MGSECSAHRNMKNGYILLEGTLKGRDDSEDVGVDIRDISATGRTCME